jgi:hypothetical protein
LIAAFVAASFSGYGHAGDDEKELIRAVKAYFDAEVAGDHKKVWSLLAPSSKFKRAHTYEMYLEMVKESPLRVNSYEVKEIIGFSDNPDPKNMPKVERIAEVRVRLGLREKGGVTTNERRSFTFLKEGGKWYKG